MEISTDIRAEDHQAFTRHVWYSGARGSWVWFLLIFLGVVALSILLEAQAGIRLDTPTMLVTMVILTGYLALAQRRIRPDRDGASLGPRTFELGREGLWERSRNFETLTRWRGVREIDETATHIFVFIDNCQAHIIPKRAFSNLEHCRRFAEETRRRIACDTPPCGFATDPAIEPVR
jgi:hypothetical protein